jgi:hypothetical protein
MVPEEISASRSYRLWITGNRMEGDDEGTATRTHRARGLRRRRGWPAASARYMHCGEDKAYDQLCQMLAIQSAADRDR